MPQPTFRQTFLLLSQVRWKFEGPKRIRVEVLYHSLKKRLLICSACPNCEAVSLEPHTVALTGPLFPQPGRVSPASLGHGGLLKLSALWSHQWLNRKWSFWLEITDSRWTAVRAFGLQASSDWSTEFGGPGTHCCQPWQLISGFNDKVGEDQDEDESELLKCPVQMGCN